MAYALITGASKGIGRAISEELAARKYDVLLIARSQGLLDETARAIAERYKVRADYLPIDLSLPDAATAVFKWCKEKGYSIEVLVNNAGYGLSGPFEKYSLDENARMMQVNMITAVQLCQLFLSQLVGQNNGYILNIASSSAYQAVPRMTVYAATKSFMVSYSRGLRQELKKTGVSVTCISPGSTDTDFVVRAQIGEKGLKAAKKVNMSPGAVAEVAIKSMFARKSEVIVGLVNKLGACMAWLLPKGMVEKIVMKIYE